MKPTHQLAAIMFTDIVGYTALMGEDEVKALELLQKNRLIQKPLIAKFNGKWLKEIGDGVLASFSTVTDAVSCAREIQQASRADDNLKLRIGIHQGEVVLENEDVFGDGVNIASRLESLAPAGSIWVSESVSRNIQNKQGFTADFVREEQLKNVKDPVKIYEVNITGEIPGGDVYATKSDEGTSHKFKGQLQKLIIPGILLIVLVMAFFQLKPLLFAEKVNKNISEVGLAIMPLRNISGNEDVNFLSYALKDEIHEVLAHSKKFAFLSSQSATAAYIDKNVSPQIIGQELGVDYALTGTYQIAANQLNVRVEFANTRTGNSIWTKKFIVPYEAANIFPIQADIANKVLAIFDESNEVAYVNHEISLESYSHFVKGNSWDAKGWNDIYRIKAVEEFEKAVILDSGHTQAWISLIYDKTHLIFNNSADSNYLAEVESHIEELSNHHPLWAFELAKGMYQNYVVRDYNEAIKYYLKVYEEFPGNERAMSGISAIYKRQLRLRLAYKYRLDIIKLNPMRSGHWWELVEIFRTNGDYKRQLQSYFRFIALGGNASYSVLLNMHHRAGVPLDSIPEKYRDPNDKRVPINKAVISNNPRTIIEVLKNIQKDTSLIPKYYSRTEYYLDLAIAYQALYKDDSSRYYSQLCITENNTDKRNRWWLVRYAYALLGDMNTFNRLMEDNPIQMPDDIAALSRRRINRLYALMYARRYEELTKQLQTFNEDFPSYGDYHTLATYQFNRAKMEYLPFAEAIANLKLPPPLVGDNQLERLKY